MDKKGVMEGERVELVFLPSPSISHLVPTVEVAKLLIRHDQSLSITFIIFEINSKLTAYIDSVSTAGRMNFITIPIIPENNQSEEEDQSLPLSLVFVSMVEKNKHLVKEAVEEMVTKHAGAMRLAGFVIDMFCTPLIDVANQLGAPTYLFFVCSAAFLTFQFYTEELQLVEVSENLHLDMPMFRSSYPAKALPPIMLHPKSAQLFTKMSQRFRETKGILVNTFQELQSYVIDTLISDKRIPPVYPVGPIINLSAAGGTSHHEEDYVIKWLEDQPAISVVFLCFGSMGSFDAEQVREIATALEGSGHRFVWCLQRPSTDVLTTLLTTDYDNVKEVLPEGFLTRTAETGKVIGWAPQLAILSHPAVRGFVSHCGWNSVLESMWCGVPVAAWPFASDNQVNAFEMVVELGLGVDLRMDYRKDQVTREPNMLVKAVEIETAIGKLMEKESEARKQVKKMSELSRRALTEGGSSRTNLHRFIQDVLSEHHYG